MRDITQENLRSLIEDKGDRLQRAHAAAIATGVVKPSPGMSPGLESVLLFLTSLPVAQPETTPRFLIWMPKELAPSPQAAPGVLRDIVFGAVTATLPQAKVGIMEQVTEVNPTLARKRTYHSHYISIDTPGCSDCRLSSGALQNDRLPRTDKAPAFLGSYDAYFWGRLGTNTYGDSRLDGYPWTHAGLDPAERLELLRRLSGNLPKWAYIYIPFGPKVAPYPLILHQGKELIFVEPGLDDGDDP